MSLSKDTVMRIRQCCSIDDCTRDVDRRGYCQHHYGRWWRNGDPLGGATGRGVAADFLKNTVIPFDGDECLVWPFSRDHSGRGKVRHNGASRFVHRVVCEIKNGPPPNPKHEAAHNCGKGHLGCVNPNHLRWATAKENRADTLLHGTRNRGSRHGNAKLTEPEVIEIRKSTIPTEELAKKFYVSRSTIIYIKSRKIWGWLGDSL